MERCYRFYERRARAPIGSMGAAGNDRHVPYIGPAIRGISHGTRCGLYSESPSTGTALNPLAHLEPLVPRERLAAHTAHARERGVLDVAAGHTGRTISFIMKQLLIAKS